MLQVAFDIDLMRPGCAVVQAGMGGSLGIANRFPVESWIVHLTPGMRVYRVTEDQLRELVNKVICHLGNMPLLSGERQTERER